MANTPRFLSAALTLPNVKITRPSFGSCMFALKAATLISSYLLMLLLVMVAVLFSIAVLQFAVRECCRSSDIEHIFSRRSPNALHQDGILRQSLDPLHSWRLPLCCRALRQWLQTWLRQVRMFVPTCECG